MVGSSNHKIVDDAKDVMILLSSGTFVLHGHNYGFYKYM